MSQTISFSSDYMEGAHPAILERLQQTNMEQISAYGRDPWSDSARTRIRAACEAPEADIFFLVGGTQTNLVVIDTMLRPWQGVIAARSGHVSTHEAGAIEYSGHKVIELSQQDGKLQAATILACLQAWQRDDNREHVVQPGMVYISQPTEQGTLYSIRELEAISSVCRKNGVYLYVDGARLAYALGCPENDVSLPDMARLCDAFYIGGTKCGALLGEAVVFSKHDTVPGFFTMMKQHGAMLAKGWVAGTEFDVLFTDDLYVELGCRANRIAKRIRETLLEKGYRLAFASPTNQIFIEIEDEKLRQLSEKITLGFWEHLNDERSIMRIAVSWATPEEHVEQLLAAL